MKKLCAVTALILAGTRLFAVDPNNPYTDRRAPLHEAPHANPPMLIALSSDDNFDLGGMEWMIETLNARRHSDNSRLRMSFFSNTRWGSWKSDVPELYATFKEAYDCGNEVTSHTATHIACVSTVNGEMIRLSDDSIYTDIEHNLSDLESIGIPREHMFGFRTPYVAMTDSTFIALKRAGFMYDASSIDGHTSRPGNFHWPFTIDTPNDTLLNSDGLEVPPAWWNEMTMGPTPEPIEPSYLPGNHLSISWNNYSNRTPIRRHSGLWELPFNVFFAPDSLVDYIDASLGSSSGGIAGASIEELIQGRPNGRGASLTKEQALATLVHNFDETYAGNRSPMSVVFHTPNFSETFNTYDSYYPNCSDPVDRQWIVEQFIDYALTKENVWFVHGEQIVNYCKNPVSADEFHPDNFSSIHVTISTSIDEIGDMNVKSTTAFQVSEGNRVSLQLTQSGVYTVKVISLSGRELFSQSSALDAGTHFVEMGQVDFTGVAIALVEQGTQVFSQKILLQ